MSDEHKYDSLLRENESLKQKIAEMEYEQKHLQNIYNIAPAGIFIYDENTVITHCNDFFVEIIGSSKDVLIGFNMRENLRDMVLLEQIEKALKVGSAYYEGVYHSVTANKSTPVKIILKKFRNDSVYVIGIAVDVSEEFKYRETLHEHLKQSEIQQTNINSLLDASPDLIFFKDGKGKWLLANNLALRIFDLVGKDYKGKTDIELIELSPHHKKVFEICVITDEQAWERGNVSYAEETITDKDGNDKIYDVIKKPVFNEDGTRKALIVLGRDITKRKLAENKLKESETKLNFLMDNVPGMVFSCTAEKKCPMQFVSKGSKTLTGYEPIEFINKTVSFDSLILPEYKDKVWNELNEAISSEKTYEIKYKIEDKTGKIKWVMEQGRKVAHNEKGIPILEGFIFDITLQEESKIKLVKSEQKYRTIIENSQDAIFIMDTEGRIREANLRACDLLGYTMEEITQITLSDVIPIEQQIESEITLKMLKNGAKIPVYDKSFITTTGERIPVEISIGIIRDYDDKELIISIARDVSERKKFESEIIKAKHKAEESDRLKSAFLANMSHEIRTPMNGILGFSQLLRDKTITPDEFEEYVDIITSNSQHLLRLIDDIINIAKIEANQLEINMYKFDLNNTMKEIENIFKTDPTLISKKDIKLVNHSRDDLTHYILSDPTRIKQIMNNLIKNAIKYTEKGSVEFGYEVKGEMLEFFVKDTGPGISKSNQKIIFDRFTRLPNRYTSESGGTGLGLSISKGLAELLDGKISLESEINHGSTFYFSIPYKKSSGSNIERKSDEIRKLLLNWEDKTVLIAEDNPTNFILLERMLRPSKINIIQAQNGKKAVDIYSEKQKLIDLILMDIKMPVLDGYQATAEIRKFDKSVPVIAVTAYAMHGDKNKAKAAGCNNYLPKPLTKDKLLDAMSQYLE